MLKNRCMVNGGLWQNNIPVVFENSEEHMRVVFEDNFEIILRSFFLFLHIKYMMWVPTAYILMAESPCWSNFMYKQMYKHVKLGKEAQSAVHPTQLPEVAGLIPDQDPQCSGNWSGIFYGHSPFHLFKTGSRQLLAKLCSLTTGQSLWRSTHT